MLPDGRRLGAHLPLGGGMVKAVERAHEIGATALQIFGDNPTAWRRRAAPPKEQPAFRARLRELDIGPVAIHAAYLVNLAGFHADFHERSVDVLAHDLESAGGFGARFVNVHAGSHLGAGRAAGAARVADGIAAALAATDTRRPAEDSDITPADETGPAAMLVIENSAGGGDAMGSTVEEIAEIADAVAARGIGAGKVGFCVDAAHAWGAGYRVSQPDEVDALIDRFDALIGLDRLVMVHLNDTRSGLGSRTDRHEHIGAGQIGSEGLRRLLVHPRLGGVTYYLETPGMEDGYDAVNVGRALDLAAGRTLAPLPPEAFELRRDRSRVAPGPDEGADPELDAHPATQPDPDPDTETANKAQAAAEMAAQAAVPTAAPGPRTVSSRA
jgi:deoxyribonuclease-4